MARRDDTDTLPEGPEALAPGRRHLPAEPLRPPSYVREWLFGSTNRYITMGGGIAAMLLSFPLGLWGVGLAAIGYATVEAIGLLYVPGASLFRGKVDREFRARRRQAAIAELGAEIRERSDQGRLPRPDRWKVWEQMRERIEFLKNLGGSREVSLGPAEVERMQDSCVDYLGLWLAAISMNDRSRSMDSGEIDVRLREVQAQIADPNNRADLPTLKKAESDLNELVRRRSRLESRKTAVEAKLLSIPDTIEEIYHAIVVAPASGGQDDRLQQALTRLQIEEDLESDLATELGATKASTPTPDPNPKVRQIAAARGSTKG